MKKSWRCPKCDSDQVGYFASLPDQGHRSQNQTRVLGRAQEGERNWGIQLYKMSGEIEAFVCTRCGYLEEYVKSPEQVPWDRMDGFRWCR